MRRAARAGMGETVTARGCSSHPEGSEPAGAGPPRKWADLSLVLPLQLRLLLESALVDPRDVLQQAAHALHCLRLVHIPLTARRTGAPVFAASMRQGALCVLHSRELRVLRQSGGRRTAKQLQPPPHLRGTRVRSSRVPAACARSVCSDDSSCRIFESASAWVRLSASASRPRPMAADGTPPILVTPERSFATRESVGLWARAGHAVRGGRQEAGTAHGRRSCIAGALAALKPMLLRDPANFPPGISSVVGVPHVPSPCVAQSESSAGWSVPAGRIGCPPGTTGRPPPCALRQHCPQTRDKPSEHLRCGWPGPPLPAEVSARRVAKQRARA